MPATFFQPKKGIEAGVRRWLSWGRTAGYDFARLIGQDRWTWCIGISLCCLDE
jgi:hypothetical protein